MQLVIVSDFLLILWSAFFTVVRDFLGRYFEVLPILYKLNSSYRETGNWKFAIQAWILDGYFPLTLVPNLDPEIFLESSLKRGCFQNSKKFNQYEMLKIAEI